MIAKNHPAVIFDLEDPVDYQQLSSAPMVTLQLLKDLVIIDEVQRIPEMFKVLRVLADRQDHQARYLILGSASPFLVKNASESLAGRIAFVDMSGFDLDEAGAVNLKKLWLRGGFPRSFLSRDDQSSYRWRQNFIRSFLERDIPQLGITIPSQSLRRFWTMLAHYHGQVWNGSAFARSLGVTEPTAKRYLDILTAAYVVNQLQPWYENLLKRQVKSPKVYIKDTGLLHALLSLEGNTIMQHPKLGFSWEGFIIEQLMALIQHPCYVWATHAGAELDLLTFKDGKRIGFEIKYTDAPEISKSMRIAIDDLSLAKLIVVYPGEKNYFLSENIQVVSAYDLTQHLLSLYEK
jgi:predicted AAA+ superfamily ATPase